MERVHTRVFEISALVGLGPGGPTMLIENRPGASTIIGTEAVSRAAPNGTTLLITDPSFLINPHLRKVNYDPVTSFEPICHLASSPLESLTERILV
jgi:tripartite-type tricarboxylate transporter receptor subunit TctC